MTDNVARQSAASKSEVDGQIVSMFLRGVSCRHIEERLGVPVREISAALRRNGGQPRLSVGDVQVALRRWRNGFSTYDIAKRLQVSEAAVHNSLRSWSAS